MQQAMSCLKGAWLQLHKASDSRRRQARGIRQASRTQSAPYCVTTCTVTNRTVTSSSTCCRIAFLCRALQEYPIFAGHIKQHSDTTHLLHCPKPGSVIPLTFDSSSSSGGSISSSGGGSGGYHFSYVEQQTKPKLDTYFRFWRSGAEPPTRNRLSSARVSVLPVIQPR
jgi:hypothetical protein